MTEEWGVRFTGRGGRGAVHVGWCYTEAHAWARKRWWAGYDPTMHVEVVRLAEGDRAWTVVPDPVEVAEGVF